MENDRFDEGYNEGYEKGFDAGFQRAKDEARIALDTIWAVAHEAKPYISISLKR